MGPPPTPEATLVEPLLPSSPESENDPEAVTVSLISDGGNGSLPFAPEGDSQVMFVALDETAWDHGETQEVKCKNSFFAVLFLAQAMTLLAFGGLGVMNLIAYDPEDTSSNNKHTEEEDEIYGYVALILCFFLALATTIVVVAAAVLSFLLRQTGATKKMIEFSMMLSPFCFVALAIACLVAGINEMAVIFAIAGLFGIWYATVVWHRIPVAAANLAVAMTAVKSHQRGLIGLGYFMTLVTITWTCMWILAVGQISYMGTSSGVVWECTDKDNNEDCSLTTGGSWIFLALLLSLYWTLQVIKNLFHTTVAGVVGSWWFSPSPNDEQEAALVDNGRSSKRVVYDSWIRSSVYSLGSICLGSLVVALLQLLQTLVRSARQRGGRNGGGGLLWCMLQCVVDQIERLAEYINKWAFVYVGLYGYDYWTAGSKVYHLFQARGWSVIINDLLVSRFLSLLQLFIGFLSGGIAVFWGWLLILRNVHTDKDEDSIDWKSLWHVFFWVGFALGVTLSDVLFRLINSAVDTVVVCFAEAPNQLAILGQPQSRPVAPLLKPQLANEMVLAWRKVYPNEFGQG